MSVSEAHRFLHGKLPLSDPYRVWVVSGQTQDVFFHNYFHGCLKVRRALEIWALEGGVELTLFIDRRGHLSFDGNSDPQEAEQIFGGLRRRRPTPPGMKPYEPGGTTSTAAPSSSNPHETTRSAQNGGGARTEATTHSQQNAQEEAERAREAAGGNAMAVLNTFGRVSQLLHNNRVSNLVIVEDFYLLQRSLRVVPANIPIANDLLTMVQTDWVGQLSHSSRICFLCVVPGSQEYMESEVLPHKRYPQVFYNELDGPKDKEIQHALSRLASRHGFRILREDAIAQTLTRHGHLSTALGTIKRIVNQGQREITMNHVLNLPSINETAVQQVKDQLNTMAGLQEVKEKLLRLEKKARSFRSKLENGDSQLPEDTLHLVITGNPGVGKTTVARLIAPFFHALGFLRYDGFKETTASTILSSNRNQSGENMQRQIEEAIGGVLIIDEAHQLGNKETMGTEEAVAALVPMAWNHRHELVIILAGYDNRMHDLYNMDQGMERRFPESGRLQCADYSKSELWTIMEQDFEKRGYTMAPDAQPHFKALLIGRSLRRGFSNAGGVKNLVGDILERFEASGSSSRVLTRQAVPPIVRRNAKIYDEAMQRLNAMQGLEPVREAVQRLMQSIEYDLTEAEHGRGAETVALHPGNMLLVGSPGTGKSTVAGIIADLLFGMGCIERQRYHRVARGELIGRFQGYTTANVQAALEQARDGVLFIDEAHQLHKGEWDSYGDEIISELNEKITHPDYSGTVFILGGYEEAIDALLQRVDPGMTRRFPRRIRFPSFTPQACARLAQTHLEEENYQWEDGLMSQIARRAEEETQRKGRHFGNAGWVEEFVKEALAGMKSRIVQSRMPAGHVDRRRLMVCDLPDGLAEDTLEEID